jgi:hypothetical protein
MNAPIRVALIWFAVVLAASATGAPPPPDSQQEMLHLRFQREHTSQVGLTLHFSGYYDGRCPAEVSCVWAGSAYGFFWITGPDIQPQVLSLPLASSSLQPRPVHIGRYEFNLTSLRPWPSRRTPVPPNEYEAVVAVTVTSSD